MHLSKVLFFSLCTGSLAAYFAYRRRKNPLVWFVIGFLFGCLGIVALFIGPFVKKTQERPKKPEPVLEGPTDCFWYYLDELQQQRGPMSFDALKQAWKRGEVLSATYVWHEHLTEWLPLQEFIRQNEKATSSL